ncbi:aminopeptidase I zinc metalloprotease-domain-containing protein [Microdochium bolleyi]|uniref:Aminopeptidase I zinc metalloprotease-domain-containing protein n=1 Tax=Microdochium bolleyi TaxID=196109 RepID=A0A136J806_9PEZI|nr:aminopeptidase I zinc metalloprotease-domain-containing protein [Microdochium bolleyi]
MTQHTPEFLRQRSSNMSLRMAAASNASEASQSLYDGFNSRHAMKRAQTAFVVGDLAKRASYKLCDDCQHDLSATLRTAAEAQKCSTASSQDDCDTCNIASIKPEAFTEPFCSFLRENPTIFHSVEYFKGKAKAAGFEELPSRDDWSGKLKAGGKYFVTRNGSAVIGFTVGKSYKPGNGVAIVAGHIDALTARLKPISKKSTKSGYVQLGVAPYAGALNTTWWDRDLSIGGRVILRDPETGKTSSKLVKLDWPIARIPTLAPHFGVGMTGSNNAETEAVPIIGLDNSDLSSWSADEAAEPLGGVGAFTATQPPKLVKVIAKELGVKSYSDIVNWELELFDLQPATVGGMDKEFIFAGRIDDKLCSWGAWEGLLSADAGEEDGNIKLVALFDDEEIGSLLRQGAKGNFLPSVIERTVEALSTREKPFGPGVIGRTYARSFLVSADVTHAVNPNFAQRYLDGHAPRLNVGIVICQDSNGHMTTDSVSTAILQRVCQLSGCTPQTFMIRNDSRSGGTVGPTISSMLGVKSADAGMPQLSMHSIRATTGSLDPGLGVKFFKAFLDKWEQVDAEWH